MFQKWGIYSLMTMMQHWFSTNIQMRNPVVGTTAYTFTRPFEESSSKQTEGRMNSNETGQTNQLKTPFVFPNPEPNYKRGISSNFQPFSLNSGPNKMRKRKNSTNSIVVLQILKEILCLIHCKHSIFKVKRRPLGKRLTLFLMGSGITLPDREGPYGPITFKALYFY